MENEVSDLNLNLNWSMASERRSPLERWDTHPSEKWSAWDGSPHNAAAVSSATAEEAYAGGFGEMPSFPMAKLQGESPVLGPETAIPTLTSGATVVLLGCESFISGLGRPQEGYKLPLRIFCKFVRWCFALLSSVFHSSGQFSAFGPSLCPCTSFWTVALCNWKGERAKPFGIVPLTKSSFPGTGTGRAGLQWPIQTLCHTRLRGGAVCTRRNSENHWSPHGSQPAVHFRVDRWKPHWIELWREYRLIAIRLLQNGTDFTCLGSGVCFKAKGE